MSKQDANGVRTAADLERKYNFDTLKKAIEQNEKGLTKTNKELENFVQEVGDTFGKIEQQLDGQIVTWYGNGEPTLSNYPVNEWLEEDYSRHNGDLYYDMDSGYPYRFILEGTTYKWEKLSDDDLSNVLAIASHAKDTADKKRRVFVTTPTPPYDVGDLWLKTITQKNIYGQNVNQTVLYRCSTAKGRDETYAESDFVSAVNYATDNNFETAEHKAEQAAETATNFIQIDTSDGVIIGDQSNLGGNILLKSGDNPGIYIRNGTTIIGQYLGDKITLGNKGSMVELCGSACKIVGGYDFMSLQGGGYGYIDIGTLEDGATKGIYINPEQGNTYIENAIFEGNAPKVRTSIGDVSISLANHTHSEYALFGHNHSGNTIKPSLLYVTGESSLDSGVANVRMIRSGTNKGQIVFLTNASSKRFKHDIHPLSEEQKASFRKLYDVEVKNWKYNEDYIGKGSNGLVKERYGLIAEDIAEFIPEAVFNDEEGNIENYDDRKILNAMLFLIQEQKRQIDSLEKRIEKLEQMLAK